MPAYFILKTQNKFTFILQNYIENSTTILNLKFLVLVFNIFFINLRKKIDYEKRALTHSLKEKRCQSNQLFNI